MSIIIKPNETFEIRINFYKIENEVLSKIKIDKNGDHLIICDASKRDFKTMSTIIEEATIINSVNGKPFLRSKILCYQIMLNFIKSIRVVDDENEEYHTVNESTINNMEYDVVKTICKKWLELTSGK
jgi:hypothetical protein